MKERSSELKNTSYELFIAALSILSVLNIFILRFAVDSTVIEVVNAMDILFSPIFLADFLYRMFTATSKKKYFFRQSGWADLLASLPLPQFKILRLFRISRAVRLMRTYGVGNLIHEVFANRGGSALLIVLFMIILVLEVGSVDIIYVERNDPNANIRTASDALWWVYVTITTVGYGDRYPVTDAGRFIGVMVLTLGVGLFGVLTGFLANVFLTPKEERKKTRAAVSTEIIEPKTRLAELKQLLATQKSILGELEHKIAELEQLL